MMHSEHPLHRSVFTSMAPFIFAIFIRLVLTLINEYRCKGNNYSRISKTKEYFLLMGSMYVAIVKDCTYPCNKNS